MALKNEPGCQMLPAIGLKNSTLRVPRNPRVFVKDQAQGAMKFFIACCFEYRKHGCRIKIGFASGDECQHCLSRGQWRHTNSEFMHEHLFSDIGSSRLR